MTTEEARRERQVRLLADTEELLATLKRLESKVDVNQVTQDRLGVAFQRTKSAVSLSMLAVLASVFLWYGQAHAQTDETSIIKCTSTWADLSTRSSTARATANQLRLDVEKTRADETSTALKDALDGKSIKVIKREINKADSDYKKAFKTYQETIRKNPIPESPKFSCLVQPFRLTAMEYIIAGIFLSILMIIILLRAARSAFKNLKGKKNDGRHSRARKQEAREAARESERSQVDAGAPSLGDPRPPTDGRKADWDRLSDGYE